jgi:hypothetical protein
VAKHSDSSGQVNPKRPANYQPKHDPPVLPQRQGTGGRPRPNTGVQNTKRDGK